MRAAGKRSDASAAPVEQQRALELYQSQERALLDFVCGSVAHDVNNPLTVILGLTQLLLESPRIAPERRASLEQIAAAAERAVRLTRNLLAYSRRRSVQAEPLDLSGVLESLRLPLGAMLAPERTLEVTWDAGVGPVRVDREHIEQVVLRLVQTARATAVRSRSVRLHARSIEMEPLGSRGAALLEAGRYVELCVQLDQELSREALQQALDPFYATPLSELSLCLAFVRSIAMQVGGDAWVDEAGEGATVRVVLPCVREE